MECNFKGFDKNAIDFLFELHFCNTTDKQKENLAKYKKYITEPLNLLYLDMLSVTEKFDMNFETKPARCLATPFTDRRFCPDTPLKEYTYLRLKKAGAKTDAIGLFFDMGSEAYGYGLKIYKPTAKGMDVIREKIALNYQQFSALTDSLIKKGFEITGEKYKKDHFPGMAECSAKILLNSKCFSMTKTKPVGENVFSDSLAKELYEAFLDLKEFTELLAK